MNLKNFLLANSPVFANSFQKAVILIFTIFLLTNCKNEKDEKIDRKALVQRHNVINTKADSLSSLSLGNGRFAITVDVTGLQTFPEFYSNGIPLGTQSEWGWHSFKDTVGYKFSETLREYEFNGRKIPYPVQYSENGRSKDAANWFRQNPHRLHLANIGFDMFKKDGSKVQIEDIKNVKQELNLWTGEIKSNFDIEESTVEVVTYVHQDLDAMAVKVKSDLIKTGQLKLRVRFPNPTGEWIDTGNNWDKHSTHKSEILKNTINDGLLVHELDSIRYYVSLNWRSKATLDQSDTLHYFTITPGADSDSFEFGSLFSLDKISEPAPDFSKTQENNNAAWANFWNRGGAIDFSGSKDPRAKELERRVVLSQYLTKIQCAGGMPPQETGLTYNSWYGRPHLEMVWWHKVHFALWNRTALMEKMLDWYKKVAPEAKIIAERQGFKGLRWQKMTDPQGKEGPSSVGSFLIWQQPHFIYLAELIYREKPSPETVSKYKDLIFATADFMASYPFYDKEKGRYILGKGIIPAQECFDPIETFNPTYELAYWQWALSTVIKWSKRAGVEPKKEWIEVLDKLSPLPQKHGLYLATESVPDCYATTRYMKDHPAVLGALGLLPDTDRLDTAVMSRTFEFIWKNWLWNETWGWDFPMTAMNAARLGKPEKAIDALFMDVEKNTYLHSGHNYQDKRLRLYLPGNGGLLTAVAMMCAGWDGSKEDNPGFPKNGQWNVKWEELQRMP